MLISGNFDSWQREIALTYELFRKFGYRPVDDAIKSGACQPSDIDAACKKCVIVEKNSSWDSSDTIAVTDDSRRILVEVKEEASWRWTRYGELGIDMISAFRYVRAPSKNWKTPHRGIENFNLLRSDIKVGKWGKLGYSKSNIWLFAAYDDKQNKHLAFLEGYDGEKLQEMGGWMKHNAPFAVNRKDDSQASHDDDYCSAAFFVKPKDIESCRIKTL